MGNGKISGAFKVLDTPERPSPHHATWRRDGMAIVKSIKPGFCQCGCGTPIRTEGRRIPRWVYTHNLRPTKTLEERFFAKVDKSGDCWLWIGSLNPTGYGHASRGGRVLGAHRLSYEIAHGPIPQGMSVLHRCDVRNCVNPAHLFLGTQAENVADMMRKGRKVPPRGERQHMARLTAEKVLAIRAAKGTYEEIARMFGVAKPTVGNVIRRETWKHV